jgi:hypothetical protein
MTRSSPASQSRHPPRGRARGGSRSPSCRSRRNSAPAAKWSQHSACRSRFKISIGVHGLAIRFGDHPQPVPARRHPDPPRGRSPTGSQPARARLPPPRRAASCRYCTTPRRLVATRSPGCFGISAGATTRQACPRASIWHYRPYQSAPPHSRNAACHSGRPACGPAARSPPTSSSSRRETAPHCRARHRDRDRVLGLRSAESDKRFVSLPPRSALRP